MKDHCLLTAPPKQCDVKQTPITNHYGINLHSPHRWSVRINRRIFNRKSISRNAGL